MTPTYYKKGDTEGTMFKTLQDQTGCVISYNTMAAGRQSVAPTLKAGALAVNPLSWTMDDELVSADKNLGAVFFDSSGAPTTYPHFTSAQIVNGALKILRTPRIK